MESDVGVARVEHSYRPSRPESLIEAIIQFGHPQTRVSPVDGSPLSESLLSHPSRAVLLMNERYDLLYFAVGGCNR